MKVLVLVADGFEDIEMISVVDLLRRGKIEVDLVSIRDLEVLSSAKVKYLLDKQIKEVDTSGYDLLFLPGGRGVQLLDESIEVREIISTFNTEEKYIAAICAAPSILGKMGILDYRNFTCYPGFEKHSSFGKYVITDVIQDGHIITGRGVAYAQEFGMYLVKLLQDQETYLDVLERSLIEEKNDLK
jgi:4-methyl-5(b-hydroxyethyl)-thiazole monophosphate biosynthesis